MRKGVVPGLRGTPFVDLAEQYKVVVDSSKPM